VEAGSGVKRITEKGKGVGGYCRMGSICSQTPGGINTEGDIGAVKSQYGGGSGLQKRGNSSQCPYMKERTEGLVGKKRKMGNRGKVGEDKVSPTATLTTFAKKRGALF